MSANLHRRHLDESQRAMIADRVANMPHGGDRRSDQAANLRLDRVSQPDAARMLNVSQRTLRTARQVLEHGVQELIERVEAGEIAVSVAAIVAKLPEAKQRALMAGTDAAEMRGADDA